MVTTWLKRHLQAFADFFDGRSTSSLCGTLVPVNEQTWASRRLTGPHRDLMVTVETYFAYTHNMEAYLRTGSGVAARIG